MQLNSASLARRLMLVGLLLVLFAANVMITHNRFTVSNPGMNDFLSRWEAARVFFQEGASPYSEEASLSIQEMIYGRPAEAGDDLGLFAYPMYTVFYVAPTIWLPYAWASAVWMVFLEVCLIAGLYGMLGAIRWRPSVPTQAVLVAFSLLNYYAFRGLILGQLSHIVFALTGLALWALSHRKDTTAGVALALATIKPQMGFLLVPFLLVWALQARRWRVVYGFIGVFGLLMAISFALQPDWFLAWVEQVQLYPTYTRDGSPVWILFEFLLGLPPMMGYVVRAILISVMLWAWWGVLFRQRHERLLWTIALTLAVTHTAGPRTATPHFMVFMLVLLVELMLMARRRRFVPTALLLTGLFLIPWLHFLLTIVNGNLENLAVFLPPIFAVWLTLWFRRKAWWALPSHLHETEST